MEKYSVLMSVYYKEKPEYLKKAIESMLNQTVKPDEFVIVKDGPLTEELDKVINEYTDKEKDLFTIVALEKNMGLGLALNEGLKVARNELIARMDSDDISANNRCEKQLKVFANNKNITLVGTNISEFINDESNIISRRAVPEKNEDIIKLLKKRCPLNHMSVVLKKSKVLEVGNYLDWHYNEDYYLWIRLYLNGCEFYNIQEDLVNVRVSNELYERRGGYKYFISEKKIQKYMLKNKVIGIYTYIENVIIRFILQILIPNKLRGFIYKKIIRKK